MEYCQAAEALRQLIRRNFQMAAIDEIYRYLNEIAPFSTAMDFDNAGFLVGDGKTEVTKALVTLDITAQSVRQAREKGAQAESSAITR